MTKKMKKQGGFTLVEMLIVVAIIAILIAVSIPLVTNALEKAREATDAANERSFKAVLVTGYLLNNEGMAGDGEKITSTDIYVFDAVNGVAKKSIETTMKPYGQSEGGSGKGSSPVAAKGNYLIGQINTDGTVKMGWGSAVDAVPDTGLVSDTLIDTSTTP